MASFEGPLTLAAVGSTGNNTHTGVRSEADGEFQCAVFKVEVAGATPTVSWKLQGSFNSTTGADGDWFDLATVLGDAASSTETLTQTKTAVGSYAGYVVTHKFGLWYRIVTSANTNITYSATFYGMDSD